MPGEDRRCAGCHESRTGQGIPAFGQNPTVAEQTGGQMFTEAIADRTEFPWNKVVQPILSAKCQSCHNAGNTPVYQMTRTDPVTGVTTTYTIPALDLGDDPVTVYYDKMVASYPASYVSIFYGATLSMMGTDNDTTGKITVTGSAAPCSAPGLLNTSPAGCTPLWGIPGSARASALTQRVNLNGIVDGSEDGTTAWPLSSYPKHPEDVGVTLTDAERKTIAVYPMDLGGQYWARQNTGFVPYVSGDPVNPQHVAQ